MQDFRESGRLGCPDCYDAFNQHLRGLLRRLHGSSQHVGEQYTREEGDPSAGPSLGQLRERLRRAVETENFELAAEIRDRIRVME